MAAFLALALAGLTGADAQTVRAAYLATEVDTWFVIVPLASASLLTGLVVSLGTDWGLFRHYWVVAKLLINVLATVLLLLHTQPIGILADTARATTVSGADLGRLELQLVVDAGAALLALVVATTLGVYKPRGLTPYGRRKLAIGRAAPSTTSTPRWVYVCGSLVGGLILLFVVLHATGRGLGGH